MIELAWILPVGRARETRLELLVLRPETENLQNSLAVALTEDGALVIAEAHAPHGITWASKLANDCAGLNVPELHATVIAARNDEAVVELKTGDAVVVGTEAVDARVVVEIKHDNSAVGTTSDQTVARELKLANK